MLHMVISRHTAESCPGREENQVVHPCLHAMDARLTSGPITIIGRWADPPAHVNYLVLDAPSAHAIAEIFMETGMSAYTTTEIHPIMSMD